MNVTFSKTDAFPDTSTTRGMCPRAEVVPGVLPPAILRLAGLTMFVAVLLAQVIARGVPESGTSTLPVFSVGPAVVGVILAGAIFLCLHYTFRWESHL